MDCWNVPLRGMWAGAGREPDGQNWEEREEGPGQIWINRGADRDDRVHVPTWNWLGRQKERDCDLNRPMSGKWGEDRGRTRVRRVEGV